MLPSLIMVANPTVNYMLYEALTNRLLEWKRKAPGAASGLEELDKSQRKALRGGIISIQAHQTCKSLLHLAASAPWMSIL